MVKLNPLATLSWSHLRRPHRLLLIAATLVVVGGVLASIALAGSGGSTREPISQPSRQLASSVVPSSSAAPATNRPRSSTAAAPTRTRSTARPGPAPSAAATDARSRTAAPGHPHDTVTSRPTMSSSPVHRVHVSAAPSPSSRPRPTAVSSHAPAPAPSAHLVGTGGMVGSVNGFRASNGASSLAYSDSLTGQAEDCALQMARNSSVAHCGGNQVVAGAWSVGGCMGLLESDPAHRDVLLSDAFSTAGSGVAQDAAGAYYCVINFE